MRPIEDAPKDGTSIIAYKSLEAFPGATQEDLDYPIRASWNGSRWEAEEGGWFNDHELSGWTDAPARKKEYHPEPVVIHPIVEELILPPIPEPVVEEPVVEEPMVEPAVVPPPVVFVPGFIPTIRR